MGLNYRSSLSIQYNRKSLMFCDNLLLGEFVSLRQAAISFVISVCPSVFPYVRMKQLSSYWIDIREIIHFIILPNSVENFDFTETLTRITGTLYQDLCTFITASRKILLRMRNFPDNLCSEIKTHILYSIGFFRKIA
jgi:hypothetical protein